MIAERRGAMARAWAEFEGDRLVCLPRMGTSAPSGHVRVLR